MHAHHHSPLVFDSPQSRQAVNRPVVPNFFYSNKKFNELMSLLDNTELERAWSILTYIISREGALLPDVLTQKEKTVVDDLSKLFDRLVIPHHMNGVLSKNKRFGDCDCKELYCGETAFYSATELNIMYRIKMLNYAIARVDSELNQGSDIDDVKVAQLQSQKMVFETSCQHLKDITEDVKNYHKKVNHDAKVELSLVMGMTAGAFCVGAAVGFAICAAVICPPAGIGLALESVMVLSFYFGTIVGVCSAMASLLPFSLLVMALSPRKSRIKKAAKIIGNRVEQRGEVLDKNPKEIDKVPLKFAKILSTSKFGFLGKKPKAPKVVKRPPAEPQSFQPAAVAG